MYKSAKRGTLSLYFGVALYITLKALTITDLIIAVVQLLRRDINGLVETALKELELVKL